MQTESQDGTVTFVSDADLDRAAAAANEYTLNNSKLKASSASFVLLTPEDKLPVWQLNEILCDWLHMVEGELQVASYRLTAANYAPPEVEITSSTLSVTDLEPFFKSIDTLEERITKMFRAKRANSNLEVTHRGWVFRRSSAQSSETLGTARLSVLGI